jgi:hypothetical protein
VIGQKAGTLVSENSTDFALGVLDMADDPSLSLGFAVYE